MEEDSRFRRALKSPIVMTGLCILAGFAVYHNVISPTVDSSISTSVASTPSPTTQIPIPRSASLMGHDEAATQWITHPARDPFAPLTVKTRPAASLKQAKPLPQPTPRPQSATHNTLVLKAVAIEAQKRSAVINRQVVYEGDMIRGYQVDSIQLKGVWLKRQGKKQFITFTANTTS